jgi:hypothetical protein
MLAKLFAHLRQQWLGALALFLVLTGGSAYALAGHNTVFSDDIVNDEVRSADLVQPPFHDAGLTTAYNCQNTPNQWINAGNAGSPVGYYRDVQGRVFLSGAVIRCGNPPDPNRIFTLPPGYRPDPGVGQPVIRQGQPEEAYIYASGLVYVLHTVDQDSVDLDAISFRCGPSGQDGCP